MDAARRAPAAAGALIIVGMVAGVLSVVPVLEEPAFLDLVATHQHQIVAGALAQFVMIPAYVGFALCLYPMLRTVSASLSLGFVGFRLMAATFHFAGVLLLVVFLAVGPEFGQIGGLLRTARDLVNHGALIIALGLGDLLLFWMLTRSRLVPRWLSAWGLLGVAAAMAASFLVLFDLVDVVAPTYLAMNAPLALQNLALALWLITRGVTRRSDLLVP